MSPTPTAPRTARTLTGDAGVGVALGQGVGTFAVDFTVVLTVVIVVFTVGTVVVTSGISTSDAVTYEIFPEVTATFSEYSLNPALRIITV